MSSNTMETAPGGETPQYESIKTVTEPTQKQKGQLGDADVASAERTPGSVDTEKGEKNAENIRYGQNVSESGMGRKTADVKGEAQQGASGGTDSQGQEEKFVQSRRAQGYGPTSPVGA